MKHLCLSVLCLVCMLVAAGCVAPSDGGNVSILYSGDSHAYTHLCGCCGGQMGGLSRRASYLLALQQMIDADRTVSASKVRLAERASASEAIDSEPDELVADSAEPKGYLSQPDDFLLLDCGSFVDAATESQMIQSNYTARAMGLMCYDAVNLGMREVQLTQEQLRELLDPLQETAVVSANTTFDSPSEASDLSTQLSMKVKPYHRLKLDGAQFFITGVTTASALQHGLSEQTGIQVGAPAGALSNVLREAKPKDIVIVMTDGLSSAELDAVARIAEVDVLIGVDKQWLSTSSRADDSSMLAKCFTEGLDRGRELGRIDMTASSSGSFEVIGSRFEKLMKSFDEHPLMVDLLDEMATEITAFHRQLQEELQALDRDEVVDYMGTASCESCHPAIAEEFEATGHAQALSTLVDTEANRNGLCLPCHTTGYSQPTGYSLLYSSSGMSNVTCESCHGPGEVHVQLLQGLETTGPLQGLDVFGLIPVSESTCTTCHEETTDPDFDFQAKVGMVNHSRTREAQSQ